MQESARMASPTNSGVLRRLQSVFPDEEETTISKLAWSLSDGENMQRRYFQILTPDCDRKSLQVTIMWKEITDSAKMRAIAEAFKLFAPQFQYGPFWAKVKVGNVILQWDWSNVVIPCTEVEHSGGESLSQFPLPTVQHSGGESLPQPPLPTIVDAATGEEDEWTDGHTQYSVESFTVEMNSERVHALMDMLVKYNTKFCYGVFSCNCQHFVSDITSALEAQSSLHRFKDHRVHHEAILKSRGTEVVKEEFSTHSELDNYVRVRLENMDAGELQFCYGHYVLFHAWHEECPIVEAWKCKSSTCLLKEVQKRL